jgi:predicted outer membrane protein
MPRFNSRFATAAAVVGLALTPAVGAAPVFAGDGDGGDHRQGHDERAGGHHGDHFIARDITDAQFLTEAAFSNRFEIVTGQLAQQRAASADVKALGAMFVQDHTAALANGAAVAQQLGIAVPEGLSPRQQAQVDLLSRLEGERFDRAWIRAQLTAHVKAVNLHLRGAVYGDSQAVRDLAIEGLPIVTRHLSELVQLRSAANNGHQH